MNRGINPLMESAADQWFEPGPAWWQRLCRQYDDLTLALARVHLRGALGLLDLCGRTAHRAGLHGPSLTELSALCDWLSPVEAARVAREIAALRFRNRAAIALVHGGRIAQLAGLVRWPADQACREVFVRDGGRVIVTWHVGAMYGIRAALHSLGKPVLNLRDLPLRDFNERARALKKAVDHLRAGGLVTAMLDGPGGTSTSSVTCLRRRIVFRRGPFVLGRMTGAPLIPVVCNWTRDGRIAVRTASPLESSVRAITAPAIEDALAASAAAWLDQYLRAQPHQLWLYTLRNFTAAPPADGV